MGRPKKQTSSRKTGLRRSHLSLELKRRVNSLLSKAGEKVKVATTKRENSKKVAPALMSTEPKSKNKQPKAKLKA